MVPRPALLTLRLARPLVEGTEALIGVTVRTGPAMGGVGVGAGVPAVVAWVRVIIVGLPFAPLAVAVTCPVRGSPEFAA